MADRTDRAKRQSRYWAWSAGIHAVALLLLIFCTPVREIVFEKERKAKPEITMSGEKLKEVIEQIRDSEEDALRQRVALLGLGVDRIRINLLNKQRNNQGFEDAQRAAAFDRVLEAMEAALAAQNAKLPLHQRNVDKPYDPDDIAEIQRQDVIARGQQDDVEAALPLLPAVEGLEQLIVDQKAASDQQSLAANFSRWTHGAAHNQVRRRGDIQRWSGEADEWEAKLGEAATRLADAETAAAAAEQAFKNAEAARSAAEQAFKDADRTRKQAEGDAKAAAQQAYDAARTQRDQSRKDRDQARKQRDGANRALRDAKRDRDRAAKTLEDRLAKLEQAKAGLEKADAERAKKDDELTWHATRARDLQRDILDRYRSLFTAESVAEQLAAEREAAPLVPLGPDGKPPLVTEPDQPSTTHDELLEAGLADLFDISDRQIAQAVTDYRAIKAIDLARMRDLAIATALDQIAPLDPLPTEVDTDLLRSDITDPELVEPHKQEVLKVKASVEEKIALVEQLLKELETFEMEMMHAEMEMEEQTLEDLVSEEVFDETAEQEEQDAQDLMEQLSYEEKRELQNQHMEALAELAREDEQQRMKDLTQLMKQSPMQPPPPPESGEESEGEQQEPPPPPSTTSSGNSLQDGAAPKLDLRPDTPGALARKISDDGTPMEWMYVDTWYTIGPFANEGRRNLNTKFPPETVVDLEAKYVGKGGQQIKWTFVQSRGPMVEPAAAEEYAIYYAYTEIHSDRPRDVWVAVGSDDKANIWINDMPVWISGDKLKGWNIQEGYRKVHLNEGINKVLYRVENGWRGVAFSMAIHTKAAGDSF